MYIKIKKIYPIIFLIFFTFISCGKEYSPEEKNYISSIEKYREEKDDYMKSDPASPFNEDTKVHFIPLNYYNINPSFVFKSKLYEYEPKDTISIAGTKGEERKVVKFGYVEFNYEGKHKINIYNGRSKNGIEYYSIWFTDKTTGSETYGVGRYLDFDLNQDNDFIYTIDFNLAYNPYCAYSQEYSCAIPSKEDHIDLAIEAGEKNFH